MRSFILGVLLAIVVSPTSATGQRQVSDIPAVVGNKEIVVDFPVPYGRPSSPPPVGYYAWRISVDAPEPFTIVLMADTAMRSDKLDEVLRASSLRLCATASPRSILECTAPLKASTSLSLQHFRLTIRDTSLVARIRRERPFVYWRSVIEPGGRVQLVQHRWEYRDNQRR